MTARNFFLDKNLQINLIKLYGSMELAPLLNLSDVIVDLVDTGRTLAANRLREMTQIAEISARAIVNKAAMKIKYNAIKQTLGLLEDIANLVSIK